MSNYDNLIQTLVFGTPNLHPKIDTPKDLHHIYTSLINSPNLTCCGPKPIYNTITFLLIRGLGHALGRVIDRVLGRRDHHHADDVPQWCRPTTSACRQWGASPIAEDVALMTEDVLVPSAKASDVAEGLAGDGVEGSAGDDAEGFPGRPCDPSVLTSLADHVAHSIWNGEKCLELKLASHRRKVEKFGRASHCHMINSFHCVFSRHWRSGSYIAFVKRWHKETSNFHLSVGELTITLDDVASLLHLLIIGAFHSFEPLHMDEAVIMLVELVEVPDEEARAETAQYQRRCEARHWIVAAHAYLLHLVSCTLFANKSATHVHVVYLDAFLDLDQSGTYAWGVVSLVHMYDKLNDASQSTGRQLLDVTMCLPVAYYEGLYEGINNIAMGPIMVTHRLERVVRQFGYVQTIPLPPISANLSFEDMNDRWMHYSDHLAATGHICVVPG
ncbi:Protein MAIN-LIKE 1 [Glycine max]|nr:Protein MAIN-LIKE 1 [Glycine max]